MQAAAVQMRPILMATVGAAIGLLPAALATGIGSQAQKPLARVVVGGMLTAAFLILVVLPVLYEMVHRPNGRRITKEDERAAMRYVFGSLSDSRPWPGVVVAHDRGPIKQCRAGSCRSKCRTRCHRSSRMLRRRSRFRQNTKPLTPEELQRAEALLPLLEGKQEFWAMGEFVHLGESSVPVLVKALTMPGPRIRYNAIETLSMLNAASGVPALINTAKDPNEMPRVREHALRVAIRLDPSKTPEAIQAMAKDQNSSIRKSAAFGSRYVRDKAVVPILIGMIADDERFVAMSAVQSLWILTLHETEFHDWDASTKADRQEWMAEWMEWWNGEKETFQIPEPRRRSSRIQG